jgi:uncharacterized membrane protein
MKQLWEVSSHKVAAGLVGWLVATNVLVWLDWLPFKVALFLSISFLPGTALLRLMRITLRTFSARTLYSFGLSLLVLMLSGLAANYILPVFGVSRPLELAGALGTWNGITALIILAAVYTNRGPVQIQKRSAEGSSGHAYLLGAASLLLPVGAMLGAFRLNNGGDALFTTVTLCYAAVLIVYVFLFRRRLPDGLLAWFIFIIGLTVLCMTSLRGWDIVGHDIQREFRVYTQTHMLGFWDVSLNRDPYNACLSITILPEMFSQLLGVSGLTVFKVILQIVFAACPAVVYILLRQYAPKLGALAGSMLFICYPTFINDSAMLTRQGVAYLFFALALVVISNRAQKKRYKLLFSLCALGAVLSHYSTAYMFVALFVAAVVCKFFLGWWQRRRRKEPPLKRPERTVLSPLFAALLLAMTFVWYTQITATSGGLATTLAASFANIPEIFSDDNKSSDTSTALFFANGKTQADLYHSYLTDSHHGDTSKVASALQYMPSLIGDELPLTWLGKKAFSIGINPSLTTTLRQNFAKVLQVLALAGVLYATYRLLRRRSDALDFDFICLNLAGVVLLVLMVLLPVLSVNYGLLRAFQQILIFLILPITLLLVTIGKHIWPWLRTSLTTMGIVVLFLLFTGVFAQFLGGSSPSLSTSNSGLYHGLYYSSSADARSFTWMKEHIPDDSDVRAANFNRAIMHDPEYPFSKPGILPSQTDSDSFVYLDHAQVQAQRMYIYYESSPLTLTFPVDYYDTEKNQIYSTTSTRVYR